MKELFHWVPWFQELARNVGEGQLRTLVARAKKVDWAGGRCAVLDQGEENADPLTFFYHLASVAGGKVEKRRTIYASVAEVFGIESEFDYSLDDCFIFPIPPGLQVLFNNSGADPKLLWKMFDQARALDGTSAAPLSADTFANMLQIRGVGIPKLTQVLFLINPRAFLPFDTHAVLPLEIGQFKKPPATMSWAEYVDEMDRIQAAFPGCQPYEINAIGYMWTSAQLPRGGNRWYQIRAGDDDWRDFRDNYWIYHGGQREGHRAGKGDARSGLKSQQDLGLNGPEPGDVVLARSRAREGRGIGIVYRNDYSVQSHRNGRIHVLWVNKEQAPLSANMPSVHFSRVGRAAFDTFAKSAAYEETLRMLPQPMPDKTNNIPRGIRRYAEDHLGRSMLAAMADAIEFAHSLNDECWVTRFDSRRRDLRLYVGSTLMLVLEATRRRVEITLDPGDLEEIQRDRMRSAKILHEYARPAGVRRYLLHSDQFVEQWESMRPAHRETMKQAAMKSPRAPFHSTDAIDFLNRTLGAKLPEPGYVDNDIEVTERDVSGVTAAGFGSLIQSLRKEGLLFAQEQVANYILALQTKRFAILTGISGTGKTKIAMAVAGHYEPALKRPVARIPDDAVRREVKPSYIKHSTLVLPVAISDHLRIETGGEPRSGPQIRVRYPNGRIRLRTYMAHGRHPMLLFKGDFKKWFQSTFEVGDLFWIRVHPSETDGPGELEIGLPETEVVEQRLNSHVVIPVRPDWVDNRGLLGYLNPLTNEYSTTPFLNLLLRARAEEKRAEDAGENPHPFFVILDEMNLARVEHYFSDFLSALESGEDIPLHENGAIESGEAESGPQVPRKLKVPGNVLFTGTVNVDETTYMFSPKVLDRAFTIEFDQVDLEGFTRGEASEEASGLDLDGLEDSLDLLRSGSSGRDWKPSREDWVKFSDDTEGHQEALLQLHGVLEGQHRHFGYRVANEIARFVNLAREQAADPDAGADAAFDLALLQKVLPKFHGTQQELESLLEQIFWFAVHGGDHGSKGKQSVKVDDWKVVAGRLIATSASQAPSGDADPDTEKAKADEAAASVADANAPAYPRTGAKVLRMIQRLRDRGFTSFIE
ncbi:MAG: hypothetical protein F4139_11455 [Gemmatimonadetes bacterium]|nr:hypothetical protein [Gemmatimonadota bacterium]MYH53537.1 hypothetical protein [Gemmatimonadota bacterium]MYK66822.1 hypothetical protein [Gemmatimonadota bacterium]